MTEVAQVETQREDRPRLTRWALAPGNFVNLYWVSGTYRNVETIGVIRSTRRGCIVITPDPFTPIEKGKEINIARIRDVEVITEGQEAKAIRKQAWDLLKEASRHINRVSTWDREGFMQAMADLVAIFPEIRKETADEEDS